MTEAITMTAILAICLMRPNARIKPNREAVSA
jgi:hypothetical protein